MLAVAEGDACVGRFGVSRSSCVKVILVRTPGGQQAAALGGFVAGFYVVREEGDLGAKAKKYVDLERE